LTVQVTTTGRTTTAGIGKGAGADRQSWKWTSILLLNVFSIVLLQQARLKGNSLRLFLILLVVSGLAGCGGSGSGGSTPPGRYDVTIQATSGNTTQNAKLALVVK
jgi:apolipoprotein N-acyltransferase